MTIPDLTINESVYPLKDGSNGVIDVFIYTGKKDPEPILDWAIANYTKDCNIPFRALVDYERSCPWYRVIITNIDEMEQISFNEWQIISNRDKKLNNLLN